jgi:hypothetical protein
MGGVRRKARSGIGARTGVRELTGAEGAYKSEAIEWIYWQNPLTPLPLVADNGAGDIFCFYNNQVYIAYNGIPSSTDTEAIYRLIYDTKYQRWRIDSIPATAMLWAANSNTFYTAYTLTAGANAGANVIVRDQVYIQDYDDGGWNGSSLVELPIAITIQGGYQDLGHPHEPKQWNQYETDVNTQNQTMASTLYFEDGTTSVALATVNTGTARKKVELLVNSGAGQQAYRASIQHTMNVTVAPTLYQENIYAAVLAEYSASADSYWVEFGTKESKFAKESYWDYSSSVSITVNLYADNSATPYFTFTLPAASIRQVVRVRHGNVNSGTTAFTFRTWRFIAVENAPVPPNEFQLWSPVRVLWKPIGAGHSYELKEVPV